MPHYLGDEEKRLKRFNRDNRSVWTAWGAGGGSTLTIIGFFVACAIFTFPPTTAPAILALLVSLAVLMPIGGALGYKLGNLLNQKWTPRENMAARSGIMIGGLIGFGISITLFVLFPIPPLIPVFFATGLAIAIAGLFIGYQWVHLQKAQNKDILTSTHSTAQETSSLLTKERTPTSTPARLASTATTRGEAYEERIAINRSSSPQPSK